ncbi:MAG: 16S rRNA (cytosine(1402)-N(4))-methyltransferase RsmH [Bryobacteraceae bacterium]
MPKHVPVMEEEALEWLAVRADGTYVDCTTGLGGHGRRVAALLGAAGRLVCLDRDAESLELAREALAPLHAGIVFEHASFAELPATLAKLGIGKVDGLLADLGWSMHQLLSAERGFSFQLDGPLDMRMDRSSDGPTAADIINFAHEDRIADILYRFGEERRSRRIARAILRARPVSSTKRLATIIEQAVPREGRISPATKTFQALRIAVNGEFEQLEALLQAIPEVVNSGGRAVIITFHSLEDRMVKRAFQDLARGGRARILTKHVVTPSEEEVRRNPASRSAKLRALQIS